MQGAEFHGPRPINRLDHLICEVSDIELAFRVLRQAGFSEAWPIGRFWPQGLTAGIALGGFNLELIQLDVESTASGQTSTLVFEPNGLESAVKSLGDQGVALRIAEKWESDPDLLALRGFATEDCRTSQMICRNAFPTEPHPFDFFLCEYAPFLKDRLSPQSFPELARATRVVLGSPEPQATRHFLAVTLGLPPDMEVPIVVQESPHPVTEVVAIHTQRGPIDLGFWSPRLVFT